MPLAGTPTQEFLQLYGEEAWKDWQRLLAHFDLGEGFAFLVLLLPGAVGANVCRRQLEEHLACRGKHLAALPCEEYARIFACWLNGCSVWKSQATSAAYGSDP